MKLWTALELSGGHCVRAFVHDKNGVLVAEAYCDGKLAWKYGAKPMNPKMMTLEQAVELDWMVDFIQK